MSPPPNQLRGVPYSEAVYPINIGDLVLFRAQPWRLDPRTWWRALANNAICWFGRSDYCHAGKVVLVHGEYYVAEMVEGCGGRLWPLRKYAETHGGRLDIFRPVAAGFNTMGSVKRMLGFVGQRYGWWQIACALAFHLPGVRHAAKSARVLAWVEGHPFCSGAVVIADEQGGGVDPTPELDPAHSEPGDLSRGPLYGGRYVLTITADEV